MTTDFKAFWAAALAGIALIAIKIKAVRRRQKVDKNVMDRETRGGG
jgi:heme exporter protein D